MTCRGNWGSDGAMENLGPFAFWWRNGEIVNQETACGELNDLMRKTENWAPNVAKKH